MGSDSSFGAEVESRRLKIWMGHADDSVETGRKPNLGQVLYVHPNPDGSRKMCGNCFLWKPAMEQCVIHDPDYPIGPEAICGYHVYGPPNAVTVEEGNIDYVDPELSGLDYVPGGTSCGNCAAYEPVGISQGYCKAVTGLDGCSNACVQALGCCTMWVKKDQ